MNTEQAVLLAVSDLGGNAYGVTIREALIKELGKEFSLSSIYSALESLEENGDVTSYLGEATAERGNRPKRYFRITTKGNSRLIDCATVLASTG